MARLQLPYYGALTRITAGPYDTKICLENDNHATSNIHYKRYPRRITSPFVNVNASHWHTEERERERAKD